MCDKRCVNARDVQKQSYATKTNKILVFDIVCDGMEWCLFDDE